MSTSTVQLYGQAWELVVICASGGAAAGGVQGAISGGTLSGAAITVTANTWEPDALRMTFEVVQSTLPSPYWFADISIYNMNPTDVQNLLANATWVTLKAGFMTGQNFYSEIWNSPVLQVTYTRENVVDQKLTLHCVANPYAMDAIANTPLGPGSSQSQIITRMANEIGLPNVQMSAAAQSALSSVSYPRGRGVFGKFMGYLNQVSDSHFMTSWMDGQNAYVSELKNPDLTPAYTYSPVPPSGVAVPASWQLSPNVTNSIIGTPQQFPQGVTFTVLLDPRLVVQLPPLVVALQNTLINQMVGVIGQTLIAPLPPTLKFFVAQVRHTGDTRGNEWQTEVTAFTTTYADNVLNGIFAASAAGAGSV